LAEEEVRSERYLHQTSFRKVRETLETVLIQERLEELYAEFLRLLQEKRIEDLQGLFALVKRLEKGEVPIAQKFREHVAEQGQLRMSQFDNPENIVSLID